VTLNLSADDSHLGLPGARRFEPSRGIDQLVTDRRGATTPGTNSSSGNSFVGGGGSYVGGGGSYVGGGGSYVGGGSTTGSQPAYPGQGAYPGQPAAYPGQGTYPPGLPGQPGAPGALVRAACIAFGCYAIGVFQGALSMWFAARAGALFGWAGLETLSLTERNQIKEQERQGWEERRARAEWFEVLFDPRAREAWRKAWFKVLFDRRARPAWFKVLFDRSMLLGGHLEDAWGHLSLHAQAFYASIILFLVATIWMAVWMYIALG